MAEGLALTCCDVERVYRTKYFLLRCRDLAEMTECGAEKLLSILSTVFLGSSDAPDDSSSYVIGVKGEGIDA